MASIFNCIETYFFITLGIAFILIILLVVHFKKQLSDIGQRQDKMVVILERVIDLVSSMVSSKADKNHTHENITSIFLNK